VDTGIPKIPQQTSKFKNVIPSLRIYVPGNKYRGKDSHKQREDHATRQGRPVRALCNA